MSVPAPERANAELARAARRLRLRVAAIARAGLPGGHTAHGLGQTGDPYDARAYAPGDPIRDVDWRLLARSGRPFVRRRSAERRVRLAIVLDRSRSMAAHPGKAAHGAALAGLLAMVAWRGGDRVRLWPWNVATPEDCWRALAEPPTDRGSTLASGVAQVAQADAMVAIGDAFEPTSPLIMAMGRAAAGAQRSAVLVTLRHTAELQLTTNHAEVRATDPDAFGTTRLDAAHAREDYSGAQRAQRGALRSASAAGRWSWIETNSASPVLTTCEGVLRALAAFRR